MLRVELEAWREILSHACRSYPDEACGALLGLREQEERRVYEAVALSNVWPGSKRNRYRVDPLELLRAERHARQRGWDVLGIYHSHPDAAPYFSRTDLEQACPWYCYLVVSVRDGAFAAARCWQPNDELTSVIEQAICLPFGDEQEETCQEY
ncbi:MAG: M67 family metallopeptidase [Bryobacterales bacterium]|nr:M67 family metallopeptidase [Bryobacteraceae bacterium]MDW8129192.1 M67 family metallopeptidase [Bryobacterales bacterium]